MKDDISNRREEIVRMGMLGNKRDAHLSLVLAIWHHRNGESECCLMEREYVQGKTNDTLISVQWQNGSSSSRSSSGSHASQWPAH
mmetsp:Transcript_34094/g.54824  ORF Transcript_34094/g.54824 Transcript_34094/m.54824 type:complete len:85 (+) Transcript_34094:434-688(+)